MPHLQKRPPPWSAARTRWSLWQRPFVAFDWLTKWVVYCLDRWAFVKLLNALGSFSLIVAAVAYCRGGPARRQAQLDGVKAKHYQAWQVINTAQGRGGNGGRLDALEELNNDLVALNGVNIVGAWLPGLRVPMGRLRGAIADSARLEGADLRGADLSKAGLAQARLDSADLRGAILAGARLENANLSSADLSFADLSFADLRGAQLSRANLSHALLEGADLRGAELNRVTWDSTSLLQADLRDAEISHASVLNGAFLDGANFTLPRRSGSPVRDSLVQRLQQSGAVFLSADSAWDRFRSEFSSVGRESHAYTAWSGKRDSGVRIPVDSAFPRRLGRSPFRNQP